MKAANDLSLSIVIPTVGRSLHLYSTIQSVFAQLTRPSDLIFVWNGCQPPDWYQCAEEKALDLGIPIKNIFISTIVDISISWRSGASASDSELIYFLGDDDLINIDFLFNAKQNFLAHTGLDVLSVNASYIDASGRELGLQAFDKRPAFKINKPSLVDISSPWFNYPPPIFTTVFRRSVLQGIDFFPYPGLAFDVWMFSQLSVAGGYQLLACHEVKVSYRRSEVSASSNIFKHAIDYVQALKLFEQRNIRKYDTHYTRRCAIEFAITAAARSWKNPSRIFKLAMSAISALGMAYTVRFMILRIAMRTEKIYKKLLCNRAHPLGSP